MKTDSKVIELFCMADVFWKFFDVKRTKYTFQQRRLLVSAMP